jgi:dihydrofolate reductase
VPATRRPSPEPSPKLSLLAALARNRVIGRQGRLPWHLPEDLKRFKRMTLGAPVIMGRKTYESILEDLGKPLPGRDNIVISRTPGFSAPGCRAVTSLGAAIAEAARGGGSEQFVIGGAEIYRLALPLAARMHLTEIDADFEGDAFFPEFDPVEWRESGRERRTEGELRFSFVTYERR